MVFHFLFNLIPLLPPLHLITPHPVEKNIPEEEVFLHVSVSGGACFVCVQNAVPLPCCSRVNHRGVNSGTNLYSAHACTHESSIRGS